MMFTYEGKKGRCVVSDKTVLDELLASGELTEETRVFDMEKGQYVTLGTIIISVKKQSKKKYIKKNWKKVQQNIFIGILVLCLVSINMEVLIATYLYPTYMNNKEKQKVENTIDTIDELSSIAKLDLTSSVIDIKDITWKYEDIQSYEGKIMDDTKGTVVFIRISPRNKVLLNLGGYDFGVHMCLFKELGENRVNKVYKERLSKYNIKVDKLLHTADLYVCCGPPYHLYAVTMPDNPEIVEYVIEHSIPQRLIIDKESIFKDRFKRPKSD